MAKGRQVDLEEAIAAREVVDRETGEVRVRNHRGSHYEDPDPTPFAPTVGIRRSESLEEKMRRMIRDEMSHVAERQGMETFDEADDFDVEDELDPQSMYEIPWEPAFEPRSPAPASDPRVSELEARVASRGEPTAPNSSKEPPVAPVEPSGKA